jgi:hypothetical protein
MTTGISPSRMHPPKNPTLPRLLTTPENDCDAEIDENLSTYIVIESAAEVPWEDDLEAVEDGHNEADVNQDTTTMFSKLR